MWEIMRHYDRVWAEIDLDALDFNIEQIKNKVNPSSKIICVIKTDGYGHGAIQIAKHLNNDERIWGFAVATSEEAISLRENGVTANILILGYTFPYSYEELILNDIRPTVFMVETAKQLSEIAVKNNKICKIHIKLDTGMTRIGLMPDDDGLGIVEEISKLPNIEIEGIFTHFATADEKSTDKAYAQFDAYKGFVERLENELKLNIPLKHCSNSAGIIEMRDANLDAVRAGIILYGLWPSREVEEKQDILLKPVLSLKSKVVYVKTVPKSCEVSYGGTFVTFRDTRIATVCIGYGDGYPRSLSNLGSVIIRGQKANIIGRVCMDQMMIDITDINEEICVGDTVTLIGSDGNETITMEELGDLSGRFNYELACDLGKRIPRVFKVDDTLISE